MRPACKIIISTNDHVFTTNSIKGIKKNETIERLFKSTIHCRLQMTFVTILLFTDNLHISIPFSTRLTAVLNKSSSDYSKYLSHNHVTNWEVYEFL